MVIRYEKKVKGTTYKITKNKFSAEGASQDAFVCAWVKLSSLKDAAKFGSWICSIAKNCAVNLVRHYCNTSIEVSYELLKNTDIDSSLDTDIAKALEQDRDDRLHEAVEALFEKISEIVKLHYLEGFSVGEISEKLNILAGNVKR
ncbi:MAG: RNA polymerase sigma factor [Ruminiclostridium sp.]|nr:RNA polymerase sigma factor [Ruminiclostridium sp.]